ncbi:hypothetical protein FRC07_004658 [Ceratobasidium sp. 392]|nr:hypothetical protein FRC07_004658 [Ceratobasidium sp. 392]
MSAALKVSLRALKASINVIPSFKSAADLLVECINTIPIAVESRKEFAELASNIMLAIKTFEEHLSQPNPPQMSEAIMNTIRYDDN